jgi:hypothetical protein
MVLASSVAKVIHPLKPKGEGISLHMKQVQNRVISSTRGKIAMVLTFHTFWEINNGESRGGQI